MVELKKEYPRTLKKFLCVSTEMYEQLFERVITSGNNTLGKEITYTQTLS